MNEDLTDELTKCLEASKGNRKMTRLDLDIQDTVLFGKKKGWDKPPLCKTAGDPVQNTGPEGVDVEAVLAQLALIHSEVSEAIEEVRKGESHYAIRLEGGKPEGVVVELADVYLRIAHLCGRLGLDLRTAIDIKMTFNLARPHRHGGKEA